MLSDWCSPGATAASNRRNDAAGGVARRDVLVVGNARIGELTYAVAANAALTSRCPERPTDSAPFRLAVRRASIRDVRRSRP